MKDDNESFVRLPEEKQRFAHLVHTLVWVKEKTGKPYPEIIRLLLHKGKVELYRAYSH